jgi:hypothetical protein
VLASVAIDRVLDTLRRVPGYAPCLSLGLGQWCTARFLTPPNPSPQLVSMSHLPEQLTAEINPTLFVGIKMQPLGYSLGTNTLFTNCTLRPDTNYTPGPSPRFCAAAAASDIGTPRIISTAVHHIVSSGSVYFFFLLES